jgi:hypothetical protein
MRNVHWIRVAVILCLVWLAAWAPARANDSASSCSNTTVNGAANDCYTVTPPFTTGAGITINGLEAAGEWTGAKTKNLTGSGGITGVVKVLRSSDVIYLLITVTGGNYQASDRIRIFFDPLHNHATTTDDIEFRIVRDTGGSPAHTKVVGGVESAWNPATLGSTLGTSNAAGSWTAELKLTAAELGLSDLPPILGFGIQAEDQPNDDLATWPANFDNTNPATSWANLKTRFPIEYVLTLDRSGSMVDQDKWTNAKKATNFLANTMAILRDPTYFDDKLGVVTFTTHTYPSYDCNTSADATVVAKPLSSLGAFPLGNYADAAPGVGSPENCTPIGRGLDAAFTTLGTSSTAEFQRVALLMSDGIHNTPSSQAPLLPAYLSYQPCGGAWGACSSSVIQVNTVALGQDSGVDTALLDQIKTYFAGNLGATYNITTDVELLKQSFIDSLDNLFQMNLAAAGASGAEFTVDPNNRKLIVILSWTTPASAVNFTLQRKVNSGDPWIDVSCNTSAAESVAVGYAICAVNEPVAGTWRAVDGTKNPLVTANRQFVVLDLNLRARFAVDQVVHGTGEDIVLTADLKQAGVAITNSPPTHPVKVTVTIAKPDEGFGTFVSTHDPAGCKQILPQLPGAILVATQTPSAASAPAATGTTTRVARAVAGTTPGSTATGDPKGARFALMDQLLRACNKTGLNRSDTALELYDDGTHGDVTANDGVYTLRFTNTQFEGSYDFDFKAAGTTAAGDKFTRVKRTAVYTRVHVDPGATTFGSQLLGQVGNLVTTVYYVTPRDRFGGYLGPGYSDQVQFTASRGQWLGAVVDYNNGIYARTLRYDRSQGEPVVTPVVQGQVVGAAFPRIPWWLCLLIIVILIMIIILLLLRRRH